MVTIENKKQVKQLVDKNLDKEFQKFLKKKNVTTRNGKTPSLNYIRIYLCKSYKYSKLDEHFLAFWEKKIREIKKNKQKVKNMKDFTEEIVNN